MAAVTHICSNCGYEGKPVKPPSDEAFEGQSDSSKALARIANLIFPGLGLIVRPVALFLSLPIRLILWPIKRKVAGGPKHCPNCGLPLMVKLNSDAGWIAKRKLDIKLGLVIIDEDGVARPGTGNVVATPVIAPAPDPGKLAPVAVLLNEEPPSAVTRNEEAVERPIEKPVTKKPVNPDEW